LGGNNASQRGHWFQGKLQKGFFFFVKHKKTRKNGTMGENESNKKSKRAGNVAPAPKETLKKSGGA